MILVVEAVCPCFDGTEDMRFLSGEYGTLRWSIIA